MRIICLSMCLLTTLAACSEQPASEPATRDRQSGALACEGEGGEPCSAVNAVVYRHPLQGLALVGGLVPGVEVHDSPSGGRYAISRRVSHETEDPSVPATVELGLVELERRTSANALPEVPVPVVPERAYIEPAIDALAANSHSPASGWVQVVVRGRGPYVEEMQTRLKREIGRGEVATQQDYERVRAALVEERARDFLAGNAELVQAIEDAGGSVTSYCRFGYCADAWIPLDSLSELEFAPEIESIRLPSVGETATVDQDGELLHEVMQTRQFWDTAWESAPSVFWNYDGNNGPALDITAAVIDIEGFNINHHAFREDTGGSRIRSAWACSSSSCSDRSTTGFTAPEVATGHGNLVAGAMIGDYTDAQETVGTQGTGRSCKSSCTIPNNFTDRTEHSASAREGMARFYYLTTHNSANFREALEDAEAKTSPTSAMSVASLSFGLDCDGTGTTSGYVNDIAYEGGMAHFGAVGNYGGGGTCTARQPATAIGAFAVGGYSVGTYSTASCTSSQSGDLWTMADACAARDTEAMSDCSSWGGSRGRSIVGASAFFARQRVAWAD